MRIQFIFTAAAALLLTACPGKETTTIIYETLIPPSAFPGTPASVSNLSEDAKALSPGGQDVTAVKVFWDGHDSFRAIVLIETRVFLTENVSYSTNATTTTAITSKTYFRHLWASFFDGTVLSKPVEIVGEAQAMMGTKTSIVTVDLSTLQEIQSAVTAPWQPVTDTAVVLFARPTTTGGFGASPSSALFTARNMDAVIMFKARDVDTNTGLDPTGGQADNSNTRLFYSYFDYSQRTLPFAETAEVIGTGTSSEREFRYGFMTNAIPVNSEVVFNTTGTSVNNVSSFGVLSDGYLGQYWWGYEETKWGSTDQDKYKTYKNEGDEGITYSNFLVAVWTEMVGGYTTARGVFNKFTGNPTPGNEIDMKMMAAVFNIETGLFGTPQEIEPDAAACENSSSIPSWVRSDGDTWVHERFVTYDNQVFFSYVDAAVDNDPASVASNSNYDHQAGNEGIDAAVAWNRFTPTAGTTSGSGSFLSNSARISPATKPANFGVSVGGVAGQDIPDLVWELVGEFDNENGKVVFGADEGLGVTYAFFTQFKLVFSPPFATTFMSDDKDLFVAQIRHEEATAYFTPADDLLEIDTLGDTVQTDTVTVLSESGTAMNFQTGGTPTDDLEIGSTNNGPTLNEFPVALITVGGVTRLVERNAAASGTGATAYRTSNGAGTYYDVDFPASISAATATVESLVRPVQDDWKVALNKSSEWFLALYRQQDATNQSVETFSGVVRYHAGDVGLYASRLATVRDGEAAVALSGKALRGSDAERLDSDSTTTNPTDASQYREDTVSFELQRDLDHPAPIQSDLDEITVLFVKVEDDNMAVNDASNTTLGDHSYERVMAVQVRNGASALTLHPGQGGHAIATYPIGYFTTDAAATEADEDKKLGETAIAADAGAGGDTVVYFKKPTVSEVLDDTGTYVLPSPANERLFASNFNGTATVSTAQISSEGTNGNKQVLALFAAFTRGISVSAPSGKYHLVMWIEDPNWAAGGMVGGGSLMAVRYNKALPSATGGVQVTAATAFTPSPTGTDPWPLKADFDAGDSVSFPVGFGFDDANMALYFTQFGEIYYNEYTESTGKFWTTPEGLPAPTLLSNEGIQGMPGAFVSLVFGGDSDTFAANAFSNYIIEKFDAVIGTTTLECTTYDNRSKALMLYCKDDGGWDAEDDGTGYNRLFCRIRN